MYKFEKELKGSVIGDKRIYGTTFDNIEELVKYVKVAETSNLFSDATLDSMKKRERGDTFYETDSLEEAINYLEFGYDKYYTKFKDSNQKAKNIISKYQELKTGKNKKDVVGFAPIVPNAILNIPQNMINSEQIKKNKPTCKIYIEKSVPGVCSTDSIINLNSVILAFIDLFERKGIRCEIWSGSCSVEQSEILINQVKVKDYAQPLNTYKLQFPVISPDMLRRIIFRLKESEERMQEKYWRYGYGAEIGLEYKEQFGNIGAKLKPLTKEILELEDTDVYIPSVRRLGIESDTDIEEIVETLIKKTGFGLYIGGKTNE